MIVNFPKLYFSKKFFLNIFLIVLVAISLFVIFGFSPIICILIAFILNIIFQFVRILQRRLGYYAYIDKIGSPVTNTEFYSTEYLMSLVPFRGEAFACSARIRNDQLLFGASKHYRIIELGIISSVNFEVFFGHKVAKITTNLESEIEFHIPSSEYLEERLQLLIRT